MGRKTHKRARPHWTSSVRRVVPPKACGDRRGRGLRRHAHPERGHEGRGREQGSLEQYTHANTTNHTTNTNTTTMI